jgi:hypothetical protein
VAVGVGCGHARSHGWMLPEHYDPAWQARLGTNRRKPAAAAGTFAVAGRGTQIGATGAVRHDGYCPMALREQLL